MVAPLLPWVPAEDELIAVQTHLGRASPERWQPHGPVRSAAACAVCFERGRTGGGAAGDRGWAAAVWTLEGRLMTTVVVRGEAHAGYAPGLLALREGPLLEAAVLRLPARPEVLLVNATGRDHPRRAGLALHLGARLDLPTIGVTTRPLAAEGAWPPEAHGARSPLTIDDEVVGYWVRTRDRVRPLAVHAAWRTDGATAVETVLALTSAVRAPDPLRAARQAARTARSLDMPGR